MEHDSNYFVMYKGPKGVWYYYVYRFGRKVRRSTGEKRKGHAVQIVLRRRDSGDILNEGSRVRPKTFAQYAEPFYDFDRCPIIQDRIRRGGHYSRDFAYTNLLNKEKYLVKAFGNRYLPEITPSMINRWILSLPEKKKITPQTANKQLTMLRQILDCAVADALLERNPARDVKPLVPREQSRGCFTPAQIKTLFSTPWTDSYIELACRLSSLTGMRLGEIRGLQREQIHEDYITIDRAFNDREGLKGTKSGKPRIVPIPAEISHRLLTVPNNGPFVFSYDGTYPISKSTFMDKLDARMDKLKIKHKTLGLSFHSFRHFFNTRLVASGMDGELVRAVIGHGSIKMTERYLHLSADDMQRVKAVQGSLLG